MYPGPGLLVVGEIVSNSRKQRHHQRTTVREIAHQALFLAGVHHLSDEICSFVVPSSDAEAGGQQTLRLQQSSSSAGSHKSGDPLLAQEQARATPPE